MKPIRAYQSIFLNILKLLLATGTLGFIGYKLFFAYHISDLWTKHQQHFDAQSWLLLLATVLLMPLNWHIETLKWKLIIGKHEPVSGKKAYQSVLSGITLGIITPNQIGNLAGKAVYLEQLPKIKGAVATLLGDIAQTFATLIIGSYGAWALYLHLNPVPTAYHAPAWILLSILNLVLVWVFVHIHKLQYAIRWKWLSPYIQIATNYSKTELLQLLGLSLFRFLVFTFQYYLLLHVFGIRFSLAEWAMSVMTIFIVDSFAPSFIIVQLGVRGALALYFIGIFSTNSVGILLSTYSLWVINMMVPGLVGLYFLLTYKWSSRS